LNGDITVSAGAENIVDPYPAETTYQANRGLIYSRNAPYDTYGSNIYIKFDFQF